jgi:hypothetical protein
MPTGHENEQVSRGLIVEEKHTERERRDEKRREDNRRHTA